MLPSLYHCYSWRVTTTDRAMMWTCKLLWVLAPTRGAVVIYWISKILTSGTRVWLQPLPRVVTMIIKLNNYGTTWASKLTKWVCVSTSTIPYGISAPKLSFSKWLRHQQHMYRHILIHRSAMASLWTLPSVEWACYHSSSRWWWWVGLHHMWVWLYHLNSEVQDLLSHNLYKQHTSMMNWLPA